MHALVSLLFVFGVVTVCHAWCGYDALKETPWYLENSAAIEQLAEDVATKSHLFGRDNSLLRIPVVWHVLTNRPANRVSRNSILLEMKWLNDWFSGKNKYYNTSDMFSAVVARPDDLKIRFELATKDPLGNPFDGIHYVNSPLADSCSLGNHSNYFTSQGGTDIWDSRYYFNVYTCAIPDPIAGYASYPSNVPFEWDGCVLDYDFVGNSHISGNTLAHEAGHWLGLRHTFNGNSCELDDWITDTPNTDKPSSNWLSYDDQCNIQDSNTGFARCGNTIMVRNVMDYNTEKCSQYFSKGQALSMRGYLLNPVIALDPILRPARHWLPPVPAMTALARAVDLTDVEELAECVQLSMSVVVTAFAVQPFLTTSIALLLRVSRSPLLATQSLRTTLAWIIWQVLAVSSGVWSR